MAVYKVYVRSTDFGYTVTQPDFNFIIDAEQLEDAINAMIAKIEMESMVLMINKLPIPTSDLTTNTEDEPTVLISVDLTKKIKENNTEAVRKNISMPAWMDMQLRYYDVDASKLFQEAALRFLEDKKTPKKTNCNSKEITTVEELIEKVPKKLLDEYVMTKLLK